MANKIHLVYCSNETYMMPTLVSAASAALYSTRENSVVIHLIDDNVKDATYRNFVEKINEVNESASVYRHKWDDSQFQKFPEWHGSRVIYARMMIQEILDEEDWAISLDGDTLWVGNPFNLLSLRNDNLLFQASEDQVTDGSVVLAPERWFKQNDLSIERSQSFCAGVMLLNLKGLRDFCFTSKMINFLSKYTDPPCPEQMVMSYLCKGLAAALPLEWGVYSIFADRVSFAQGGIIHYVSDHPWNRNGRNRLMSDTCLIWHDFASKALRCSTIRVYVGLTKAIGKRILYKIVCFLNRLHGLFSNGQVWIRNNPPISKDVFNHIYKNLRG